MDWGYDYRDRGDLMIVPTLVNLTTTKTKALKKPLFIGLGSRYGNPFSQEGHRLTSIREFEDYWRGLLGREFAKQVIADLASLSGTTMCCYCRPKPCHGDVLIKLFREVFCDKLEVENEA